MKTIITVISDMHLESSNSDVNPTKIKTQDEVLNSIEKIIKLRVQDCDRHITVFLGDLADTTLKDNALTKYTLLLSRWKRDYGEIYGVIGNHEVTYGKNKNPYMHIAYGDPRIENRAIEKYDKIIEIRNELVIEDTKLVFWHHNDKLLVNDIEGIKNIFVFGHNNVLTQELKNYYVSNNMHTLDKYVKYNDLNDIVPVTDKLRAIYLGHAHNILGKFVIKESILGIDLDYRLYQLSALNLPKHNEFDMTNKRIIPGIIINSDTDVSYCDELIEIFTEKTDHIDMAVVQKNQATYAKNKERKELKELSYIGSDIIPQIVDSYRSNMTAIRILTSVLNHTVDLNLEEKIQGMNSLEYD